MGFNNSGAKHISKKIKDQKRKIPIGINIGKSRVVDPENTEAVLQDYLDSMNELQEFGDYIAINVSSPNTPNLRAWEKPEQLKILLKTLKKECLKPLFVKISPDLEKKDLDEIVQLSSDIGINGIIATNTTKSRDNAPEWTKNAEGGISGRLLSAKSLAITKHIGKIKPKDLALISVGGICS